MSEPNIKAKAPILQTLKPGTYYFCRCGYSDNQPFCNGSHKGSEFTPLKFDVTEERPRSYCQCKHTGNAPWCDGTHKKL